METQEHEYKDFTPVVGERLLVTDWRNIGIICDHDDPAYTGNRLHWSVNLGEVIWVGSPREYGGPLIILKSMTNSDGDGGGEWAHDHGCRFRTGQALEDFWTHVWKMPWVKEYRTYGRDGERTLSLGGLFQELLDAPEKSWRHGFSFCEKHGGYDPEEICFPCNREDGLL